MIWNRLVDVDAHGSNALRLKNQGTLLWNSMSFFAHSGDSWFWMAGLIITWLVTHGEWHRKSSLIAIAVSALAVLVLAIKFTVRRQRPAGEWGAIYRNTDPHSFPSGHAARVFLLATMAVGLGPLWFALLLVIWAPLVSISRVAMGVHYLSDIIAGMILGLLAGWVMLQFSPLLIAWIPWIF